ncbi:MAG TPA: glycerol-3-phosphate acyltransferase [Anaerolineales bacterium]|nr:glycerol-3-phosphate acyltransferase [Anaerolineales bacterium]
MVTLSSIGVLLLAYLLGSIPFGLIIVKLTTGKNILRVESGRTGGTNAMRAAGLWAGIATAVLDVLKGVGAVFFTHLLVAGSHVWIDILAPFLSIIGHNYSAFLIERGPNGRLRFRGGAGGAPCLGGAIGLWLPSLFVIVPLGGLIYYFGGYASITTMSVALLSTVVFAYRAWLGLNPWQYAIYGLLAFIALAWSLKPNIYRLIAGNERVVGLRAKLRKLKQ